MRLLRPLPVGCAADAARHPPWHAPPRPRGRPSIRALDLVPATPSQRRRYALDFKALDAKWQHKWSSCPRPDRSRDGNTAGFVLPMFPYPSGSLHLGHLRVYTIADVVARHRRLAGHPVSLPMGWDAFGLPAENAALERGLRPDDWTRANIAKMKAQLDTMNGSWDWDRVCAACSLIYIFFILYALLSRQPPHHGTSHPIRPLRPLT